MDLGLADVRVCIKGGSKGMGRAAARCFAADGARAVVLARDQGGIEDAVAELDELGAAEAWGISTDLLVPSTIDDAFAQIG